MCQTQPLLVAIGLVAAGASLVGLAELRRREAIDEGGRFWAPAFRLLQAAAVLLFTTAAVRAAFSGC